MSKPVDNKDFWKKRIKASEDAGDIYYSVYITSPRDWKEIERAHSGVIRKEIQENHDVLDVACGYGRYAPLFNPEHYMGFDFSDDFIELARERHPNYVFEVQNALDLPYKDNEFDWAVCGSFKQMIISNQGEEVWDKMEKEILRVSKKFLVLEYTDPYNYEILG